MRQAAFLPPVSSHLSCGRALGSSSVCPDECVAVSLSGLLQILLSSFPEPQGSQGNLSRVLDGPVIPRFCDKRILLTLHLTICSLLETVVWPLL